eukprot:bmy_18033T0
MGARAVLGTTLAVACAGAVFSFLLRHKDLFWGETEECRVRGIVEASKLLVDEAVYSTMRRYRPGSGKEERWLPGLSGFAHRLLHSFLHLTN